MSGFENQLHLLLPNQKFISSDMELVELGEAVRKMPFKCITYHLISLFRRWFSWEWGWWKLRRRKHWIWSMIKSAIIYSILTLVCI
jgi:hypothetical protein